MNRKILYLHGFASSGASGTVELLRRAFWHPGRGEEVAINGGHRMNADVVNHVLIPYIREKGLI